MVFPLWQKYFRGRRKSFIFVQRLLCANEWLQNNEVKCWFVFMVN
jgi:hypothetical protein